MAGTPGQVDDPVDHERAALLIGLHHKSDAVPACKLRIETETFEEIERNFQSVRLFGIDIEADVVLPRQK